jgi:ABC-type antimicrobial peptide transport system permease subunit
VQDLEHWISSQQEYEQEQLVAWLFGAFASLALALSAVGLYSVVSYSVAQPTNSVFVLRWEHNAVTCCTSYFTSIVGSVGSGIVLGVVLTLALNKVLAKWSQGSSRDPPILLAVTVSLGVVAVIACSLPAKRAVGVDPIIALRYE